MSSLRPMHAERTDDPDVLRWVVHHPSLVGSPAGVRRIAEGSELARLVADGSIVDVEVRDGDVWIRCSGRVRWPDLATGVHTALAEALDDLDRAEAGDHWLLTAQPSSSRSGTPSISEIQQIVDRAAGVVMGAHGGSMIVDSVDAPSVRLRAQGACHGCRASDDTLLERIAPAIARAHPYLTDVVVDGNEPPARDMVNFLSRRR